MGLTFVRFPGRRVVFVLPDGMCVRLCEVSLVTLWGLVLSISIGAHDADGRPGPHQPE